MPRTLKVCRPEHLVHAGDVDMPVLFGYMSRAQWNQLIAQQHPAKSSDPFISMERRNRQSSSSSAVEPPPLLSHNTSSSINSFTSSNSESIASDVLATSMRQNLNELPSDPSYSLTESRPIVTPECPTNNFLAVSSKSDSIYTNNDPVLSIANEVQELRKQIDSTKKMPAWPSLPSSPTPVSQIVPPAKMLSFELEQFSDLDEANYTAQIDLEVMLALHRLAGYGHMVSVDQYMKQPDAMKWVYLADRVDQKQAFIDSELKP